MEISATDVVKIRKVSMEKRISVEVNVFDSVTGEDRGTYGFSWRDAAELAEFLNQRTIHDILRPVLTDCVDTRTLEVQKATLEAKVDQKYALPEAKVSTATEAVKP